MKIRVLVRVAAAALIFWTAAAAGAEKSITVFVGEVRVLDVGSVDRVAVGNGKLLSTTVLDNGQLLVLAQSGRSAEVGSIGKNDENFCTSPNRIAGVAIQHIFVTNQSADSRAICKL